jgi:multidrug efflux pump subunit AcrB/outer membrane protein TolC
MNPVRASLRYPQVTLVLAAMFFLVGVAALITMPRREDPKITIHTGLVVAVYPGATSEQVEERVTRKIEEHLFRFSEVRRAKTFSTSRNGIVVVNVELNESTKSPDEFWSKLRLDMAQLKQTDLPAEVRGPIVDSDFGDTVAVLLAVHGRGYAPSQLTDYAKTVEARLRTLPAVSKIRRIGDQDERIEIDASSERISQLGVNPDHVLKALAGRNTIEYAGGVGTDRNKVPIEASGQFKSEDEIKNAIVDVSQMGKPVHVYDIGTVQRVYADPAQFARIDIGGQIGGQVRGQGEATILLAVEMQEGNNIVFFGRDLRRTLDELKPLLPPGLKLDLVADQPRVVQERVMEFFREFGIAIVAVILVTMLLLPLRVALVSAVAIPVTVSTTFGLLWACGVELQQVSIAALITVLGMVVDDAIVIADNYVELLDRKVPREEAAWRCATEMAVPVLTATLTIIASFAPMLLLTGAIGEFIRALPIAVAIALGTSYVVAMTLTPLTARFFIRQGLVDHANGGEPTHPKFSPLERMQQLYNLAITHAMRHKKGVLAAGVGVFVFGLIILQFVPQEFFPLAERNQFVMDVWLPEGAKIEATDAAVKRIEQVLKTEKLVASSTSFIGFSAPRFYYNVNPQPPTPNYAQILVNTKKVSGTPELVAELRQRMGTVAPEAQVYVKELQQGQVMEAPVEVRIVGDDLTELRQLGDQVEEILRHTPGATYIHTDWRQDEWQLGVHMREEVANRMGLTDSAVAQQLGGDFEGAPITTAWEGDRSVDVVFRLDAADRAAVTDVADTYVLSPVTGARVPVSAVATLKPTWEPGRIVRRNGARTITVRAFPGGGRLASQILSEARRKIDALPLPAGYRIEYGGEFANQNETFSEMQKALGVSLVLIFLILLFQFRSFIDPLIVMMAFPLALPGAALGLLITHNCFGFTAFMGIVSLGGLVVRNSIILIDYIHVRMREGVEIEQAALEAGERRLRPIFLTTMAAAIGVLPMILSGSSMWSPLASVIAFGLLGSMFFTLVVIPALFVAAHRFVARHMAARTAAKLAVPLLLMVLFAAHAQAAPRHLTLDEALKLAAEHNPTVLLAELKARATDAKVTEARANYFPELNDTSEAVHSGRTDKLVIPAGSLGVYPSAGPIPSRNIDLQLGNQNFLLSSTTAAQPITQLFKIHSGVTVAHADASAAHADARRAQDEIALNVRKLYLQILAAERKRKAAALRIEAGEAKLGEAQAAVDSGVALELKALEGKAQLAEARHQLGTLDDAIADMQVEFANLIGLPLDTEFDLAEPEMANTSVTAEAVEAEALRHNPQVAAAEAELSKAKAGVNAARAEFIPDVGAFAQYVYQSGVPLLSENNGIVGLHVNWTLTEWGKRTGLVRERTAERAQAEENLEATRNRVRVDVEKETRKVERTETGLEAAREAVDARAEMRRIVANQVQAKTANPSALKEAEAQLAEAEATLYEAEVARAVAHAELDRTVGQ